MDHQRPRILSLLRSSVPALLAVTTSAAILSGAYWIHTKQGLQPDVATTIHDVAVDGSMPLHQPTTTMDSHSDAKPSKNATTPSTTANHSGTTSNPPATPSHAQTTAPSKPAGTQPAGQQSNPTPGSGFSPVKGGAVKDAGTSPEILTASERSTVIQYGAYPATTWHEGQQVTGLHGEVFTLPSNVSPNQFLAIRLETGFLWTVIPATGMDTSGRLLSSVSPATIYFTPYAAASNATPISKDAISLGVIPTELQMGAKPLWDGWYHPADASLATGDSSSSATNDTHTSNTDASDGNRTGTSSNQDSTKSTTTPTTTSTTAPSTTSPSGAASTGAAGNFMYVAGFYKTTTGAVIVLSVHRTNTGTTEDWLFSWDEHTKALQPISALQTGNRTYSWFAVGDNLVYFGQRQLLDNDQSFSGKQAVYNDVSGKTYPIALGTWTSQAVVVGSNLLFRDKQSVSWKLFTPDASITQAPSS